MTFTMDGGDFRNKVLRDKIDVSVVFDMDNPRVLFRINQY